MGRSLLLLVSGFVIIFGIIQNGVQNHQEMLAERSPEYYYQEQSRNIAGAMLEIVLGNINENYLSPTEINDSDVDMLGGTGKIKSITSSNFKTTLEVEITGEIKKPDNKTAVTTIKALFNRKAFSIYAYFSNYEPSNYVFVTGDVYNGPVHTNGRINFLGDPVFNGPVTTHNGSYNYSGDSNPVYNDIHDFNSEEVVLPTEVPEIVNMASEGGLKFDNKIRVEFKKNGKVKIKEFRCTNNREDNKGRCLDGEEKISKRNVRISSFNGVISSNENVEVEGVLDGQVTLHSKKDVRITGDLVYKDRNYDDEPGLVSDDMLGIISEGDTIIDKDAEFNNHLKIKDKGPNKDENEDKDEKKNSNKNKDIYIDASVLTLGDRFLAEDFDVRGTRDRGTVHLLGGAIQNKAGSMGLVDGNGNHLGGYSNNDWSYDTRFAKNSTPGFPRKRRFEIENWRESTTTVKNN